MLKPTALLLLSATTLVFGQKTQSESDNRPGSWQKMKDCAAQAEKVGPVEAEANNGSYTNHYSAKYDRCYVRITWLLKGQGEEVSEIGERLVDAFEHDTKALSLTPQPQPGSKKGCFVDGGTGDCAAASDFISEHMRN